MGFAVRSRGAHSGPDWVRHAGGDGSHGRVPSVLAAWAVVAPYRDRLTGSLTEPGAASIHSEVVGYAGAAVAGTASPAIAGSMVITWRGAIHKSKLTTVLNVKQLFCNSLTAITDNRVHQ